MYNKTEIANTQTLNNKVDSNILENPVTLYLKNKIHSVIKPNNINLQRNLSIPVFLHLNFPLCISMEKS